MSTCTQNARPEQPVYMDAKTKTANGDSTSVDVGGAMVKIGSRCPVCGYRVRGMAHCTGTHHRKAKTGTAVRTKGTS